MQEIIANNIYALNYINDREVIAGCNLNIVNNYAVQTLYELGVKDIILSIESSLIDDMSCGMKYSGHPTLMTYTHCPFKTVYNYNDCKNCKFNDNLTYINNNGSNYKIRRIKLHNCYFELVSDSFINGDYVEDLR